MASFLRRQVSQSGFAKGGKIPGIAELSGTGTRNNLQEELRSVPDWSAVLMLQKLNLPPVEPR